MLAYLIYLVEMVRRMARKIAHGVWIVVVSFREAQALRRRLPRSFMEE